jgi:hypothetical protein
MDFLFKGLMMRVITTVFLMALVCLPAHAREKSDVLILKNGNDVNGEIIKMARGLLTLKTDSMGTLEIKWEDIEQISSKFQFAVQDTLGRIFVGTLQVAAEPKSIDIVGPRPARNLRHIAVVEIREARQDLWYRFSGAADFGYTFTKASERRQFTLSSDLKYSAERYEAFFSFDATISSTKGPEDTDRKTDIDRRVLTFGGTRNITGKWLIFSRGRYEQNFELNLDRRWSFLGGPEYIMHRTNRSEFVVRSGISYTRERYIGEEDTNNAEAVAGTTFQFFKLYTPKVDLVVDFLLLPNLTTGGRVRLEFDTKVRLEVVNDLFVSFSFYNSYDSKPPSETATKNDYGFVTGVTWTFNR